MNEPIEEVYFNWLYSKVAFEAVPTPSSSYWTLLRDLHSTEFIWLVPGDENRAGDGLDIRKQFLTQSFLAQEPAWLSIPCSVLEMLIGFARRADFQVEFGEREWFWVFLANLKLDGLNDAEDDITHFVTEVMDEFLWRTYRPNGVGGMFPLKRTSNDQRKVEVWYQFCEWLVDQGL